MPKKPKIQRKPTQSELAAALGVSRQLISLHARKPDAPPLTDVSAWTAFLAAHGRDGSAPPDVRRKIAEARLAILNETQKRLERENQIASAKVMPVEDAQRQATEAVHYYFGELDRLLRELPPAVAGMDAMAVHFKLKKSLTDLRDAAEKRFEIVTK